MIQEHSARTLSEAIAKSVAEDYATRAIKLKHRVHQLEQKKLFSVWAPPLFWGPWIGIFHVFGVTGPNRDKHRILKLVSYSSISQAKSSFDVEIKGGDRFVRDIGPNSSLITITGNVSTTVSIRAKSHSIGQNIRVNVRVCGHSGFPKALISDSSFQKGVCNGRKAICFE